MRVAISVFIFTVFVTSDCISEVFSKENDYSVQLDDWLYQRTPLGDQFTYKKSQSPIQISIQYGPTSIELTEKQFFEKINSKEFQAEFAKKVIGEGIPLKEGFSIKIKEVAVEEFFNIQMLKFMAVVEIGFVTMLDTSYIGIHKNRIVKVSLNYYEGELNDSIRKAISRFFGSLKFTEDQS